MANWTADKRKSQQPYFCRGGSPACIQNEVLAGPVEAAMTVFGDIWSYTAGVYSCTGKGSGGSGHSVVIVGYGVEPPANSTTAATPYWLVKNSWGSGWGMEGFFKVTRGTNDCGIEGGVHISMPDFSA